MPGDPVLRPMQEMWETFRLGPPSGYAGRAPFPGQQFPVDRLEDLARQVVPRWPGNEAATTAAYAALLDRLGRSDIVAHSQGCGFALAAARKSSSAGSGAPDGSSTTQAATRSGPPRAAARVPHLVVWGDSFAGSAAWQGYRAAFERYAAALVAAGGTAVETIDLPARGIRGNSHMLTMDRNSDRIAALVADWLARRPLANPAAPL